MALEGWDPLRDLLSLQERMNRLFEESLSRRVPEGEAQGAWVPPADVAETAECFVIEIDLPGCSPDDIAVQAGPRELLVRGARVAWNGPRPERFHRLERHHGGFSRRFELGQAIVPDGVTCRWSEGLLRIELPKAQPRSRRIPVESRS